MSAVINLRELGKINMGIDLCGADITVSEHFLYRTQVTTA